MNSPLSWEIAYSLLKRGLMPRTDNGFVDSRLEYLIKRYKELHDECVCVGREIMETADKS